MTFISGPATDQGEVAEPVVNFLKWFYHFIEKNEIYHVENMYEDGYYKISGNLFAIDKYQC
jgi:hypothetical protein